MINDCQKRTYEAGREATESKPRAKRAPLLQILLQMRAQVNPISVFDYRIGCPCVQKSPKIDHRIAGPTVF